MFVATMCLKSKDENYFKILKNLEIIFYSNNLKNPIYI